VGLFGSRRGASAKASRQLSGGQAWVATLDDDSKELVSKDSKEAWISDQIFVDFPDRQVYTASQMTARPGVRIPKRGGDYAEQLSEASRVDLIGQLFSLCSRFQAGNKRNGP
jgi:hypothetical protein